MVAVVGFPACPELADGCRLPFPRVPVSHCIDGCLVSVGLRSDTSSNISMFDPGAASSLVLVAMTS